MNRPRTAPAHIALLGLIWACSAPAVAATPDPFLEAERQERADLERLRDVNSGELRFLDPAATADTLHTRMWLTIVPSSPHDGWVNMRQCHDGLDAMSRSEVVYRYVRMEELRIVSTRNIDSATIDGASVQLHGVRANAELCVSARVNVLHAVGDGGYRIVSGPYHRRFFDGYFPLRLSLEITYPVDTLDWQAVLPPPQDGFVVRHQPGRLDIETHFVGELTVTLDFAARR